VIVQLPLPGQINAQSVLNAIPPEKDLDVLGERALGAFYAGRGKVLPPAVAAIEEVLKKFPLELSQSAVAVVGPGRLVGKPAVVWLLRKAKEVLVFYRGSDAALLKNADLVILGAGVPGLINAGMLKDGALVLDFGYGKNAEGKISGDLDVLSLTAHPPALVSVSYTPTPGGTGPILVAKILENFYKLNT
ncbi:MAG: bifunctional 5,10-methylene-tetrahydrofolate dehydrogenase/5,10-methylene-tetrahydrofolate cyclohydrolase, partial [Candidatus Liptonbacteria bacterium]|nr:bifunctional 5,10-methylene-tetrahydrofolate dehydrogenase/5,10-methylene-tetrahydrofolate cyclohydrolase [Candidatus Liptonbacteria bacterium]